MSDPIHAVVVDETVLYVLIMDTETAQLFREYGFVEMMWGPGASLVDVTDAEPQPSNGWTYHSEDPPVWREPEPLPVEENPVTP